MAKTLLVLVLLLGLTASAQPKVQGVSCYLCEGLFSELQGIIKSKEFISMAEDIATGLCSIFEDSGVCSGLVQLYGQSVAFGIGDRFLNPNYACPHFKLCEHPSYFDQTLEDFTKRVLEDMPEIQDWPESSGESYKIMQVTDIHADFYYTEGSQVDCDLPLCCRSGTGKAGAWGSFGECDIPSKLIDAFLQQAAQMDIEYIVWTGDNPPHDIWAYEREKEMNVTRKLVSMFKQYIKVPVYPIIGNHDCFPMDLFDPGNEQILLGEFSSLWEGWLGPEVIKQFGVNGFYTTKDPKTGVRIIGMNNELGDNMNFKLMQNNTDPGNMINWIYQTLLAAEKAGEKVLILGHIPHGCGFANSLWARHYRVLVNRFQNIIIAQMFGHTHNDQFNVVSPVANLKNPAGVLSVGPSLTTYSYHNPGFRVYEFDSKTNHLINIYAYRLDLAKANANPEKTPVFEVFYDYKSLYSMKDMSPQSFMKLAEQVRDDPNVGQTYKNNFNSQYAEQSSECGTSCRKSLYCQLQSDVFDDNYACDIWNFGDILYELLELFYNDQWEYIVEKMIASH